MTRGRRSYKRAKALVLYSFFQLAVLLIWEFFLGLERAHVVSGYSEKVLVAGTLVAMYAGLAFWVDLKKRYRRIRRADFNEEEQEEPVQLPLHTQDFI